MLTYNSLIVNTLPNANPEISTFSHLKGNHLLVLYLCSYVHGSYPFVVYYICVDFQL